MRGANLSELIKLRSLANYQFGDRIGEILFPKDIEVTHSRKTGRIREIYFNEELIAVYRPRDGLLSLSLVGAKKIMSNVEEPPSRVVLSDDAVEFVRNGKTVFAKHVIDADRNIRPQDETVIVNGVGELLAVGRAILSGEEMISFKKGVAVRVRKGVDQ